MPDAGSIQRRSEPIAVPGCVAGARRVLLFGGSFDPPHLGHAGLPFTAVSRWWGGEGAWVVFVPAARSPHKDSDPAPDRHRVEMLRLCLRGRARWWIWRQELVDAVLNRGEASYWADTWAIAGRVFGGERAFLIGADQALAMHRWRRYDEFWRSAVVMRRADQRADDFVGAMRSTGAWSDADLDHWSSRLVETPTIDASSTVIRAALADPSKRNAPIEGLDRGVQKYILDRGLYAMA